MGINQINAFGLPPQNRSVTVQQNAGSITSIQSSGGPINTTLNPGQTFLLPAGNLLVTPGLYSDLQQWDPASQLWRGYNPSSSPVTAFVASDGTNTRIANASGCAIGAAVITANTTLGATYPVQMITPAGVWQAGTFTTTTSLPMTIVASGGTAPYATFNMFVGGAISTTISKSINAGTLYTLAPTLIILPPANQGNQPFIPATAYCTVTAGGAINAITVVNQGAGYVAAPTVLVVNAIGDTTGSGAVLTAALTGAGQITAVTSNTVGGPQTAVPTLTLTSGTQTVAGSPAITAIMNFSIVAGGTPSAGVAYTGGYSLVAQSGTLISGATGTTALVAPAYLNPNIEQNLIVPVQPIINGLANATAVVAIAAGSIQFGGAGFQNIPKLVGLGYGATTLGGIAAPVVGGYADTTTILSI